MCIVLCILLIVLTLLCTGLRSQYDPNLREHGYVRVTYKETLSDPENKDASVQKMWHPLMSGGAGELITDPKGVLFMAPNLVVDVSQPASPEPWKHGDIGDAEGLEKKNVWRKKKVMSDILEHRMLSFTHEQQDQWRTLNEFHERFQCSDQVPNLPFSLHAGGCTIAWK